MKATIVIALALSLFLVAPRARADRIGPGSRDGGAVSIIGKGVNELGIETMLTLNYGKSDGASDSRLALAGGFVFRRYLIDNLALDVHLGGFFRRIDTTSESSAAGGLGTIGASYAVRLGGGMFFFPGLGVGGFFGKDTLTSGALTAHASEAGFAARVGAGLIFYPSARFNLFARPEAIMYFGKSTPEAVAGAPTPDGKSFTAIDAGFNVGLSYVF